MPISAFVTRGIGPGSTIPLFVLGGLSLSAKHIREQIMKAVVRKVTGLSTTGSNVYRGRIFPQEAANLPALLVYQGADVIEDDETARAIDTVDSTLTVHVEAWVQGAAGNNDQTLNAISAEVVAALQADITQGVAGVFDTQEGVVVEAEHLEGNQAVGALTMDFLFRYRRLRTDPSVAA
jgi:hypothetical protein